MSRKVCVLRSAAEVEALATLILLKDLVQQRHLTEMEAREALSPLPLPDCGHHHHLVKREARRQERVGLISFVPGWDEQYAEEATRGCIGRRFRPGDLFSGDQTVGELEMYASSRRA